MGIQDVLGALEHRGFAPRPSGPGKWMARCPAHEDTDASLSIREGDDGRVLLSCMAGCKTIVVLDRLGLKYSDLFPPREKKPPKKQRAARLPPDCTVVDLAARKGLPPGEIAGWGVSDMNGGGIKITYRLEDGAPTPRQRLRYRMSAGEGSRWTRAPEGDGQDAAIYPYGLWHLPAWREAGDGYLIIVEGETDCWTLWHHGYPALGIPGAATTRTLTAPMLAGIRELFIVQEPDGAGEKMQVALRAHLATLGWAGTAATIVMPRGCKDPSDLHLLCAKEGLDFRAELGTALQAARVVDLPPPADDAALAAIPWTAETAMAKVLREVYPEKFRYVVGHGWMLYTGRRWEQTSINAMLPMAERAVRIEAKRRLDATDDADEKDEIFKALKGLCSRRNLDAVIVHNEGVTRIDDANLLNADPFTLNCANGTVDIQTGMLRPHRAADLLTKISPVRYDAGATCPRWEQFLSEIMLGDEDAVRYLQRAIGYTLTGDVREKCFFICYGASGDNGKSTFISTLQNIMGTYARAAAPETFNTKDGDTVRNDLAAIYDARLVHSVERDGSKRLAVNFLKWLTGRDTITMRFLFKELFDARPCMHIWFAVNDKPRIYETDGGTWNRPRLIPFLAQFGADQIDRNLEHKLAAEAPGILSWAVRGAQIWLREGLGTAPLVAMATRDYRQSSDPVGAFFDEMLFLGEDEKLPGSELKRAVADYCADNEHDPKYLHRAIVEKLRAMGCVNGTIRAPYSGESVRGWRGVKIRETGRDLESEGRQEERRLI